MKPPSLDAGKVGNWIATTNKPLKGLPKYTTSGVPPVVAFLSSDLLFNSPLKFYSLDYI